MNKNVRYEFRGQELTIKEISILTGVHYRTLLYRLRTGRTIEQAVTERVLTRQECGRRAAMLYRERLRA